MIRGAIVKVEAEKIFRSIGIWGLKLSEPSDCAYFEVEIGLRSARELIKLEN